jgi:hypothetical protein
MCVVQVVVQAAVALAGNFQCVSNTHATAIDHQAFQLLSECPQLVRLVYNLDHLVYCSLSRLALASGYRPIRKHKDSGSATTQTS